MHFHLDNDEELVIGQVWFCDLVQIPKGERSANPRRKLFESHLLTSPENKKKIEKLMKSLPAFFYWIQPVLPSCLIFATHLIFSPFGLCQELGFGACSQHMATSTSTSMTMSSALPPSPLPPLLLPDIMKLQKKETNIIRVKHEYKRGNTIEKLKEIIFCNPWKYKHNSQRWFCLSLASIWDGMVFNILSISATVWHHLYLCGAHILPATDLQQT